MKGATTRREEDPDRDRRHTHKNHRRRDELLNPHDTDNSFIQKKHVEFECPDETNVGVPPDHEPLRPFLTRQRLLRCERQSLLHRQVRRVAGATHNVGCHCHTGVTCLWCVSYIFNRLPETDFQLTQAKKMR